MNGFLVVLGATGTQGASIVDHVLKQLPGLRIRGVSRNASSTAALALQKKGVEVVEANVDDPTSLVAAFKDATAIYAVTDFWEPFLKYLQSGRQDAWTLARADELQRGKNVVDAAGQTLDTLQHFIFSSLPSGDQISNHVLTKLHHHEGKADVVHYLKNSGSKRLADITTVFWCGYYMENFARYDLNPYIRPRKDGSGDLYITTRAAPSTPFGFLATRKDVGLFVASMLQRTPQGVYGPPVVADSTTLTFEGVCEALGKVVGRKIVYRQAALGEMGTHYPVFGGEFDQLYELFNNYGFSGGQKTLGREELGLSKVTTSFETFVSEQNWDGFVVESEK